MLLSYEPPRLSHLPSTPLKEMPLSRLELADVILPYVLDEKLVRSFNYWEQGIQRGMQHGHELYTHLQSYATTQRDKAYTFAFEQTEQGHEICITVSPQGYGVWRNLRSKISNTDHYALLSGEL